MSEEDRGGAAELQDHAAQQRDRAGETRDGAGDDRDLVGRERDEAGGRRDHVAHLRDRSADQRDRMADQRDRLAEERDRLAEQADPKVRADSVTHVLNYPAQARQHASSDRERASQDRVAGAGERSDAALDRDTSHADRTAGAGERSEAGLDRQRAQADRVAAATDRDNAPVDAVTGTYLRGPGFVELAREIARAKRTQQSLVVVFVDVDGLKAINDSQGHAAGDRILLAVADTLRAKLRPYDVIIRYGGDEFVCVLTGLDLAEASGRLASINTALADTYDHVSITLGIAELQENETWQDLVERADVALYRERAYRRRSEAPEDDPDQRPASS